MTTATATKHSARAGADALEHSLKPIKQRIAFVSGGMGGIGTAVCRRLARSGVKVVAGCLPGYEKKDDWIARMRGEGLQGHAAEGNVDDYESCADMFYQIGSVIGPVDILVNNAGITRDGVFKRMSPADWYAVINTNLNSVFNVTRQVIEGMMERGWGRIVNLLRERLGESVHSRLGCRIIGLAELVLERVYRRDVDDATPAALHHAFDHLARDVEDAVEIGIDHRVPVGGRHALENAVARDARIIDEDVHRADHRAYLIEHVGAGLVVVDVALGGVDLQALPAHPCDPVIFLFVAGQAACNDLDSAPRQAPAHRRADSAHAAAHERNALFERGHGFLHRLRAGARTCASHRRLRRHSSISPLKIVSFRAAHAIRCLT